jgi:hypothetical protein
MTEIFFLFCVFGLLWLVWFSFWFSFWFVLTNFKPTMTEFLFQSFPFPMQAEK